MKQLDIKKALNELLKSKYDLPIYGKEVAEGYNKPSFFTEIVPKGHKAETKNFASDGFTLHITYFQEVKDETDQLTKIDEIKDLFGMVFTVGERKLTVGDYSYDFIGQLEDILQIQIEFDFKENTYKAKEAEAMESLEFGLTQEGE